MKWGWSGLVMSQPLSSSRQRTSSTWKLKSLGLLHWKEMREGLGRILDGPKMGTSNGNVLGGTKWSPRSYCRLSNTWLAENLYKRSGHMASLPQSQFPWLGHGGHKTHFPGHKKSSLKIPWCSTEVMGPGRFACHFMMWHTCFFSTDDKYIPQRNSRKFSSGGRGEGGI